VAASLPGERCQLRRGCTKLHVSVFLKRDSQDSVTSPCKRLRMALRSCEAYSSSSTSLIGDADMDVNLHGLVNDNSVDLVGKFHALIQQQPMYDDDDDHSLHSRKRKQDGND